MKKIIFMVAILSVLIIATDSMALNVRIYNGSRDNDIDISVMRNKGNWSQNAFNSIANKVTKGIWKNDSVWWSESVPNNKRQPTLRQEDTILGNHKDISGIVLNFTNDRVSVAIPVVPRDWNGREEVQRIEIRVDKDNNLKVKYLNNLVIGDDNFGKVLATDSYDVQKTMEAVGFRLLNKNKKRMLVHTNVKSNKVIRSDHLNYVASNGNSYTGEIYGDKFIHMNRENPSFMHLSNVIEYTFKSYGKRKVWRATLEGNTFTHTEVKTGKTIVSDKLRYTSSGDDLWELTFP